MRVIGAPKLPDGFYDWPEGEQRAFTAGLNMGGDLRAIAIVEAMMKAAESPVTQALGVHLAITTLAAAFDQDIGTFVFDPDALDDNA